jgi:hypothetical protein
MLTWLGTRCRIQFEGWMICALETARQIAELALPANPSSYMTCMLRADVVVIVLRLLMTV